MEVRRLANPFDALDIRSIINAIGRRKERDESARLVEGLGRDDAVAATLVSRVLHWTSGHPYLTQRMCQAVQGDEGVQTAADVDLLCEELFFSERARDQDSNLQFVRNQMLWRDLDHAALLGIYADVARGKNVSHYETNPLTNVIRVGSTCRRQAASSRCISSS